MRPLERLKSYLRMILQTSQASCPCLELVKWTLIAASLFDLLITPVGMSESLFQPHVHCAMLSDIIVTFLELHLDRCPSRCIVHVSAHVCSPLRRHLLSHLAKFTCAHLCSHAPQHSSTMLLLLLSVEIFCHPAVQHQHVQNGGLDSVRVGCAQRLVQETDCWCVCARLAF